MVWANQTVATDEAGGVKGSGDVQLLVIELPEVGQLGPVVDRCVSVQ